MSVKRYTDWSGWWIGLRAKLLEAAGTSISTLIGSNGVAAMNIPGLDGIGMNWKTAVGQFGIHLLIAAGAYTKANQPQVITETFETTHITKDEAGNVNSGSSKTTTVTPVPPTDT